MPTLLDYFNNDFNNNGSLSVSLDNTRFVKFSKLNNYNRVIGQDTIEIKERVHLHGTTSTRLPTFYIPQHTNTFDIIIEILKQFEKTSVQYLQMDIIVGSTGDLKVGLEKTAYTPRMYFYTETHMQTEQIERLSSFCKSKKIFLTIRSLDYLNAKIALERPKAFISHDSHDKELIAKRIAKGLSSRLYPVWYDEYSLKIGDSLRESIESGIKEANKCILILTPSFLSNSGWTKKEFNSIFTRELIMNEKIVLPVWYEVSAKEIYEYSPSLADTFALTWPSQNGKSEKEYNEQVEEIISQIHTALAK
jgi:hypothetical protein